jgi:Spy/CpxP family protein refolding chaperone
MIDAVEGLRNIRFFQGNSATINAACRRLFRGPVHHVETLPVHSRLFVFLSGAVLAVSLSACSGSGSSSSGTDQGTPAAAGQAASAAPGASVAGGPPQEGGGAGAQGAGRGRRFGELLKSLNLTDDQKTKIRAIMADARKKSEGADRDTRRANMRAAFNAIETTVLTPPQRAEFEKKLAEMRAKYASPSPAAQ